MQNETPESYGLAPELVNQFRRTSTFWPLAIEIMERRLGRKLTDDEIDILIGVCESRRAERLTIAGCWNETRALVASFLSWPFWRCFLRWWFSSIVRMAALIAALLVIAALTVRWLFS